jgi:small subunit ribosomal protein S2
MAVVTARQLLESGVHFGHQTRRWNPKMKRFILTERNGIYIIDLHQSLTYIDQAYAFIKDIVGKGGQVLFVGTKKQAQEAIAEQATRVGMPYVNQRWLGGMLTNFHTMVKRIQKLKELESMDFDDVAASGLTKKELLGLRREKDKLSKTLGGIRDMTRVPQAVWIVDTKKEHLAVDEARKLHIPIIGILDTNCDPDEVDWPIPGNDDAIRSVGLLTRVIADAVADGLMSRSAVAQTGEEAVSPEPMPAWERELLGMAEAAAAETVEGEPAVAEEPPAEAELVVADELVVVDEPVVNAAEAVVAEEPPAEEPAVVADEPVAAEEPAVVADEPVAAEEPAVEAAKPVVPAKPKAAVVPKAVVADEPVAEEPVAEEPVADEPVADEAAADTAN